MRTASSRNTSTGTPQGGILSPLLANIALSVLDEHFAEAWQASAAPPTNGSSDASGAGQLPARPLRGRLRGVGVRDPRRTPRPCGRRWRRCSPRWACACRRPRRGSATSTRASTSWASASSGDASEARTKRVVYTYPSKKALASIVGRVRALTRRSVASDACRPAAPAQPGAAGLVHLLPPRRVQGDLRLPRPVHLASGGPVDPQAAQPQDEVGRPPPPLPSRGGDRPRTKWRCSNPRR